MTTSKPKPRPLPCQGYVRLPDGRVWPCPSVTTLVQPGTSTPLCQKCQKVQGLPRDAEPDAPRRGRVLSPEGPRNERKIRVTDPAWEWCAAQPGGGSDFIARQIDLRRATSWVVEVDSLAEQVPDRKERFPERWRAEQFAAEQADRYRCTQGSVTVCGVMDGREVGLYELCLNAPLEIPSE